MKHVMEFVGRATPDETQPLTTEQIQEGRMLMTIKGIVGDVGLTNHGVEAFFDHKKWTIERLRELADLSIDVGKRIHDLIDQDEVYGST